MATSSVPQGSHTGPVLFLIFCKDLDACTEGTECKLWSFADDTKFLRVIKSTNDMQELQLVIDRAQEWSSRNKIPINPTKTVHVTFAKTAYRLFTTMYFIGTNEIQTKDEFCDLGITFDAKLTFKSHAQGVERKSRAMHGASYRFALDIHNHQSIINIVQLYIRPMIEYGAIIWRNETEYQNKNLEASLRFASRMALRSPYDVRDPYYIPYTRRMAILRLLTMRERHLIASIIFAIKCARGEVDTPIGRQIFERAIRRRQITRNPNIFRTDGLAVGSRISRITLLTNEYRTLVDINETTETNRKRMKLHFLEAARAGMELKSHKLYINKTK